MRVKISNNCCGPGNGQSILKDHCCVRHNPVVSGSLGRLRGPGAGARVLKAMVVGTGREGSRTEAIYFKYFYISHLI